MRGNDADFACRSIRILYLDPFALILAHDGTCRLRCCGRLRCGLQVWCGGGSSRRRLVRLAGLIGFTLLLLLLLAPLLLWGGFFRA